MVHFDNNNKKAYIFLNLQCLLHTPHAFLTEGLQPESDGNLKPVLVVGDRNTKQFSEENSSEHHKKDFIIQMLQKEMQ